MNFILDTNICIHMMKNQSFSILKHAKRKSNSTIAISSITEAELWHGVWNSQKLDENQVNLTLFLSLFSKIPFQSSHAKLYGAIKFEQRKKGNNIGHNDLMIAAQAIDLDAILVTANEKELKQIVDLRIENWLRAT